MVELENDMIWLSTSLFCNKENWHILMANGILPFVNGPYRLTVLESYLLEFNYLSGENIRLSLLTTSANAPELAKGTDTYFKRYFRDAMLPVKPTELPVRGVFAPFPANTIQYGLYPPQVIAKATVAEYQFPIGFTTIILDALKDDVIDDETIITFAFYLQMGLIKMLDDCDPHNANVLQPMLSVAGAEHINTFREKYQESKDTLAEITAEIMDPDGADAMPPWFQQWQKICKMGIRQHETGQNIAITTAYKQMGFSIARHLGISHQMNNMVLYFIHQSLFANIL